MLGSPCTRTQEADFTCVMSKQSTRSERLFPDSRCSAASGQICNVSRFSFKSPCLYRNHTFLF